MFSRYLERNGFEVVRHLFRSKKEPPRYMAVTYNVLAFRLA